jgi:hypothetical protein
VRHIQVHGAPGRPWRVGHLAQDPREPTPVLSPGLRALDLNCLEARTRSRV